MCFVILCGFLLGTVVSNSKLLMTNKIANKKLINEMAEFKKKHVAKIDLGGNFLISGMEESAVFNKI